MAQRYTRNNLVEDVESVNATMEEFGIDWRYVVGGRYGYTALDAGTVEITNQHCVNTTVQCGTPRECREALYRDSYYKIERKAKEAIKENK